MTNSETRRLITAGLSRIEGTRGVVVLYACESGSRAWGFESKDSDYDVRFIYMHDPAYYLSISDKRSDTMGCIDADIDYVGWDLRKTLRLFRKSNPNLYEWLTSPIEYRRSGSAYTRMHKLMPSYYSPRKAMYHYYHMARGNHKDYLQGDTVWVKKYFYVLRPIMAYLYIERDLGMPPVLFEELIDSVIDDAQARRYIRGLVRAKKEGGELRKGPRIDILSEFIEHHLKRIGSIMDNDAMSSGWATAPRGTEELSSLFRSLLCEVHEGYDWCREWWEVARQGDDT